MSLTAETFYNNFINYLYKYYKYSGNSYLHHRSSVASAVTVIIKSHAGLLPYLVIVSKMTTHQGLAISKTCYVSFEYLPPGLMIV